MNIQKTVMVSIVGRPNVGKSTLTNALVGDKVAITSPKPQTTRTRICGILNQDAIQYIFMDTPGLHKPRSRLGDYMVKVVQESISDVDVVLLLVDPVERIGPPEQALIQRLKETGLPCILSINKIDTIKKETLLSIIALYQAAHPFETVVPISAKEQEGLDLLLNEISFFAVEGPQLFPDDMTSDQPERQIIAEIVREKMLLCLDREVPHGVAVEVTRFTERENGIIDLDITIYCEKASHKGIIIGKKGAMLKQIAKLAREDIETFMGTKVYMETWVKVKENWRDNQNWMYHFGYDSSH